MSEAILRLVVPLELPAKAVALLANWPEVDFVSLDRPTLSLGHVTSTTGADAVRGLGTFNGTHLDGSGIAIAILDSGIDPNHVSFLDRANNRRIVFSRDFTGEGRTDDPYGHGTHVAAIAAGNGRVARFDSSASVRLTATRISPRAVVSVYTPTSSVSVKLTTPRVT